MCWLGPRRCSNSGVSPLLLFVSHSALCLWLVFLFLIPRLSAVRDLGQELAHVFNVLIRPQMNGYAAAADSFWCRDLSCFDIAAECCCSQPNNLGDLICGAHSVKPLHICSNVVKAF